MKGQVITMAGPRGEIRLSDLSNYEAGLAMLGVINQVYPGIRFGQLHQLAYGNHLETMGRKWWQKALATVNPVEQFHNVAGVVGDVKDGIGDVLKDSFDSTADGGGSLVRLLTDEKVINAANSSYQSFTSSGGVGGAVVGNWTGGGDSKSPITTAGKSFMDWIVNLGGAAKAKDAQAASVGSLPPWAIPAGVAGVGVLWFLTRRR